MRRAKAWRVTLELPDDGVTPAALTAMIEQHVAARIEGKDARVDLRPVFIVDVLQRGSRWLLELETVHESQNGIGPKLTLLSGASVKATIEPVSTPTEEPQQRGDLSREALRGLHVTFFPSQNFQSYVSRVTGREVHDAAECKAAFKAHFNVQSCQQLKEWTWIVFLREFNAWLKGGRDG